MKNTKMKAFNRMLLMSALALALVGCLAGCVASEVRTNEKYTFQNPEPVLAQTDVGIVIDGVLDEEAYKNNNWLYLHNEEGGNNVNIAMTSHYGEKGIYFVFDVTESVPIYVNMGRPTYMNSCIELYLAPSYVKSMQDNGVFEIDLLPSGDLLFKRGNGKISGSSTGFGNVATTNDIMARFGATTKGGEINTEDCYGYCLELFIPWDYLDWLDVDTATLKESFVYINPAHITAYNISGTNANIDRYWYQYAPQIGASFANVTKHFRFGADGVMGGTPINFEQGEHYTISGADNIISGMSTFITVKPDDGYTLTSVLVNGKEEMPSATLNKDGSVTLKIVGNGKDMNISAVTEKVSEGTKNLVGKVTLKNHYADTFEGVVLSCVGPDGEYAVNLDANGNFVLDGLKAGYYMLYAEKDGYTAASYSIYLTKDVEIELPLYYDYIRVVQGEWDLSNQFDGRITIVDKAKDGATVITTANTYTEASVTVKDLTPSKNEDGSLKTGGFSAQIAFVFDDGKKYEVRIHNTDSNGLYKIQTMGSSNGLPDTKWKWLVDLTDEQTEALVNGDGVKFTAKLEGTAAVMYVNGTKMTTVELGADYAGKTAQVKLCLNGCNTGEDVEIPFELK